jgi:hypothetical protein
MTQASVMRIFLSLPLLLLLASSLLSAAGCADAPCRKLRHPEMAAGATIPSAAASVTPPSPNGGQVNKPAPPAAAPPAAAPTVLVYKPDGSLQCGMGKGMAPEEMEKQLSGIRVLARDKRSDGLMHIQVCGQATGMINVFEIPAESLKEAEGRGFKKLERR